MVVGGVRLEALGVDVSGEVIEAVVVNGLVFTALATKDSEEVSDAEFMVSCIILARFATYMTHQ